MPRDDEPQEGAAPPEQKRGDAERDDAVRDKAKSAYLKWYKANRVVLNRTRRARYSEDTDKRLSIIERQRQYRKDNPPAPPARKTLPDRRGRVVEVFRMGEMAEIIKRDEQIVRIWEKRGYIPAPSIPSPHRYYTHGQVLLLTEFSDLMRELRYDAEARERLMPAKSRDIASRWEE